MGFLLSKQLKNFFQCAVMEGEVPLKSKVYTDDFKEIQLHAKKLQKNLTILVLSKQTLKIRSITGFRTKNNSYFTAYAIK